MSGTPSPVDPGPSPVAGRRSLPPWKIGLLICAAAVVVLTGPHALQWLRAATEREPKAVAALAFGPGMAYRPPALPDDRSAIHPAVAQTPLMPGGSGAASRQGMDPLLLAARTADIGAGGTAGPPPRSAAAAASTESGAAAAPRPEPGSGSPLAHELTPTPLAASKAIEIPNPRLTIEQGTLIPCTQQSAIDTSYPGMVTATIPVGIRGATGDVVLLDAGSKVVGSVEHGVVNGLDRGFVLWRQITTPIMYDPDGTPRQLRIRVDSPAADEIGETGLDMDVDRHVWRKLSGVIGLSLIQGSLNLGAAALSHGNGSNNLNFNQFAAGGDQVANTLLQSTIQIPDVGHRNQGLACTIFVARDLSFADRYALRAR